MIKVRNPPVIPHRNRDFRKRNSVWATFKTGDTRFESDMAQLATIRASLSRYRRKTGWVFRVNKGKHRGATGFWITRES